MNQVSRGAPPLVVAMLGLLAGCAQHEQVRTSATWLATANNTIKERAANYKDHRDALAKARRTSTNALERYAAQLESDRAGIMAFWGLPEPGKSQQRALLDAVMAETIAAEERQRKWEALTLEHERTIAAAQSSVASVGEQLAKVSKALAALAEEPDARSDVEFLASFFSDVNTHLEKLEADARKKTASGIAQAARTAPAADQ
jgi:hypothetical protein